MNSPPRICFCLATILAAESPHAQGTFENLNFEQANIVPIVGNPFYPYAVTVANALPGWSVEYGAVQQTVILYNAPTLGDSAVTLYANGYPGTPGPIIDGNYSIDDITFSTHAVPEPTPLALTGVGALLFALYRRFAPKRP